MLPPNLACALAKGTVMSCFCFCLFIFLCNFSENGNFDSGSDFGSYYGTTQPSALVLGKGKILLHGMCYCFIVKNINFPHVIHSYCFIHILLDSCLLHVFVLI